MPSETIETIAHNSDETSAESFGKLLNGGRIAMSFWEACTLYVSTSAAIWAMFERVEKFSSKANLETVYLLLTVKRSVFSVAWYESLLYFIDKVLGVLVIRGRVVGPSVWRVLLYSSSITILTLIYIDDGIFRRNPRVAAYLLLTMLPAIFLFDYCNFLKTRAILAFVAVRRGFVITFIGIALDYVFLVLLLLAAEALAMFMQVGPVTIWPELAAKLLDVNPVVVDGNTRWDETFYYARIDMNNIVALWFINAASASLSTLIIILYLLSTLASYCINRVSLLQSFVDKNTAVLEKPLQVFGVLALIPYGIIFFTVWTFFNYWFVGLYILIVPGLFLARGILALFGIRFG